MRKNKGLSSSLIHRKLAEILIRETKDPRFARVTISRVEAAPDFSFAKVFYAIFPAEHIDALTESLNHAAGFFSHKLGKALQTRNTPKLVFVYDAGFDHSMEVDQILKDQES